MVLDPIDGPYANFRQKDELLIECQRAGVLGMAGQVGDSSRSSVAIAEAVFFAVQCRCRCGQKSRKPLTSRR